MEKMGNEVDERFDELVAKFKHDYYNKLPYQERANLIKETTKNRFEKFGLDEIPISFQLNDPSHVGCFNADDKIISFNDLSTLGDSYKALQSIIHEVRHYCQLEENKGKNNEMEKGLKNSLDYPYYIFQAHEKDAFSYTSKELKKYNDVLEGINEFADKDYNDILNDIISKNKFFPIFINIRISLARFLNSFRNSYPDLIYNIPDKNIRTKACCSYQLNDAKLDLILNTSKNNYVFEVCDENLNEFNVFIKDDKCTLEFWNDKNKGGLANKLMDYSKHTNNFIQLYENQSGCKINDIQIVVKSKNHENVENIKVDKSLVDNEFVSNIENKLADYYIAGLFSYVNLDNEKQSKLIIENTDINEFVKYFNIKANAQLHTNKNYICDIIDTKEFIDKINNIINNTFKNCSSINPQEYVKILLQSNLIREKTIDDIIKENTKNNIKSDNDLDRTEDAR